MRRWFVPMVTVAAWILLTAAPALAGGVSTPAKPAFYVVAVSVIVASIAFAVVVCLVVGVAHRPLGPERSVQRLEPLVQQPLLDRDGGQKPDHVVVGARLQDHDAFLEAAPDDRVPIRTA